jgi:hypothetical protein
MSKGRNTTFVGVRLPDDVVGRLKILACQRRQTMSDLLRHIIGKYAARRYSPGRPRGANVPPPLLDTLRQVGILPSMPVVNPAGSVAAAAPGARLSSEVDFERLASDLVASPPTEAHDVVASPSKEKYAGRPGDRYPGTARGAPCPCGSGEKYKRCCGKSAPPKEL